MTTILPISTLFSREQFFVELLNLRKNGKHKYTRKDKSGAAKRGSAFEEHDEENRQGGTSWPSSDRAQ